MCLKITDSFLHAISSFWYELNKSGNFSKMGTLICLGRNPSCYMMLNVCVTWRDILECELRTPLWC